MNRPPFDLANSHVASLTPKQLTAGVRELEWCRDELATFDVFSIEDRDDPSITALETAIDEAVLSLFEKESAEFKRFRRDSLVDNAYFSLAYPTPIHEVRAGLAAGVEDALERLSEAISALRDMLIILGADQGMSHSQPPAQETYFDEPSAPPPPLQAAPASIPQGSNEVLLVGGRDDTASSSISGFLTQVDLSPVPFDSSGPGYLSGFSMQNSAGFAIIVVTPDDVRTRNDPNTSPDFQPSPSQEVVFRVGFLTGLLGPDRVCLMVVDDAELDLTEFGIQSIPMDAGEGWMLVLAKTIKSAGLPIDLNKAI